MSISFGSGIFKTEISAHQINKIMDSNYQGDSLFTDLWEKIKDFFFSTGRHQAIDNLKKLCNPEKTLNINEVEGIFFKLKELASPMHKDRFCNSHLYSSKDNCMHIQGDDGNLGKLFICDKNNVES